MIPADDLRACTIINTLKGYICHIAFGSSNVATSQMEMLRNFIAVFSKVLNRIVCELMVRGFLF